MFFEIYDNGVLKLAHVTRQTNKTYFYKYLKPSRDWKFSADVLFISCSDNDTFKKYKVSLIEYEDTMTHKILKRILDDRMKTHPDILLTENEIDETFYYNDNRYNVNEYINHPF